MKPRNMLRFFALMSVVALLLVLILTPAHARDVPFAAKHTVDDNFGEASDVTMADVDGDGDLDILGAGWTANEIAWWENVNQGSEAGGRQHVEQTQCG